MRFKVLIASAMTLTAMPAVAAAPGDVSAHEFYVNALALKKKGMMALMSKKLPAVKAQFGDAIKRVREDNLGAKAKGAPKYCPPEKPSITANALIDGLAAIPEPRRRAITLVDAWREMLIARYPCR